MDAKFLAGMLNGREYGEEITEAEAKIAKRAGLVVVFGASDDLMEFEGAIRDERPAYRGIEVWVDREGLLPDFDEMKHDSDNKDQLREYFRREPHGKKIEAVWADAAWIDEGKDREWSWTFKTEIPHETFEIKEEGTNYCRGIVFRLEDCK